MPYNIAGSIDCAKSASAAASYIYPIVTEFNNIILFHSPLAVFMCGVGSFDCNSYNLYNYNNQDSKFIYKLFGVVAFYATLSHEVQHMKQQADASEMLRAIRNDNSDYNFGEPYQQNDWNSLYGKNEVLYNRYVDLDGNDKYTYPKLECDLNGDNRYGSFYDPSLGDEDLFAEYADYVVISGVNLASFKNKSYNCRRILSPGNINSFSLRLFDQIQTTTNLCGSSSCIIYERDVETLDYDNDNIPNIYDVHDHTLHGLDAEYVIDTNFSIDPIDFENYSPFDGFTGEYEAYYRTATTIHSYFMDTFSPYRKIETKGASKGAW